MAGAKLARCPSAGRRATCAARLRRARRCAKRRGPRLRAKGARPLRGLRAAGLGRYFSSKTNMVHSTVGTPFYMSPECIQGSYYDWKSDIWSLGCLLYELATLRSPFFTEGLNYYTLGKKINKRAFEPISGAFSAEVRRAPSNPRRLRRTTARAIRATYCLSLIHI